MSLKSGIIILVLSVAVTYGVALLQFGIGAVSGSVGFPFGFSRFNFLGGETNNVMLLLDVAFWFVALWFLWKILVKLTHK